MPIKIIDETQYALYTLYLTTAKTNIDMIEQLLLELRNDVNRFQIERNKYYIEVLGGEPIYSHSVELIDKFISDHKFTGTWPKKYQHERYFYYDEKSNSWDCYSGGLNVVYYREVELRYNELKLEGSV